MGGILNWMENPSYVKLDAIYSILLTYISQAFVGANSYVRNGYISNALEMHSQGFLQWLPLLTTEKDVETTFDVMESAGVKVLRTWVKQVSRL